MDTKEDFYSVCELCKEKIIKMEDCVELMVKIEAMFMDEKYLEQKGKGNVELPIHCDAVSICKQCFLSKNSIKTALTSYLEQSARMIPTNSQDDYNESLPMLMTLKGTKNNVLKLVKQLENKVI